MSDRTDAFWASAAVADESAFRAGRHTIGLAAGHGLALTVGGTSGRGLRHVQYVYAAPRWAYSLTDPLGTRPGTGVILK